MRRHWLLLLPLTTALWSPLGAQDPTPPAGCGAGISSLYYNLCDLTAVWGVVVEAFAATGIVASLLLLIILPASLPFAKDPRRRSSAGLQAGFLLSTLGLFGLAFAFVVGRDFATCAARRFLFGVLFAGCFSCLLMQGVRLSALAWRAGGAGPGAFPLCLAALALWLVEAVINTEWLVITVARAPPGNSSSVPVPCRVANQDFVMALIYVMVLLVVSMVSAMPALVGRRREWRKGGCFVVLTAALSVAIWVAWIVMYVFANARTGGPSWDDPTLAIALVANGWVFLLLHAIPEVCSLTDDGEVEPSFGDDLYATRGVGYETILKEQSSHNMYMENKAFSMDEPAAGYNKPMSPYSGYNGQMRSSVYQPTELALITKGGANQMDHSYDTVLPRATATPPVPSNGVSFGMAEESPHGHLPGASVGAVVPDPPLL
ncbi:G-protein coupled receptor family C group 5 member C isoform X2 [Paramormyrops kingsleyae]|uniref:G-protein coupled receptor family C group 5 member C isoform X2 n=1 Tax=Paramormyrops kingsleyae TaxID=1676925 RepID=UPI003B97450F